MIRTYCLILLSFSAVSAWAQPQEGGVRSRRGELAVFIRKVQALEAADPEGRLADEIATLRDWVLEAQRNLEDDEALAATMARVQAQVGLVEALLARSEAEANVRTVRAAASTAEREAIELRRQLAEAEQARAVLEQKEAALRAAEARPAAPPTGVTP